MVGPGLLTRPLAAPLGALLVLGLFGCRRYDDESARARAEGAVLERQVAGLRALVALAEQGPVLPAEAFAIGVDETLVRDLLAAGLPLEAVVGERFRARVERAEVSFEANQSQVSLHGRVSTLQDASTFVDLTLRGALDRIELPPASGRLRAKVVLDGIDVQRASAAGMSSTAAGALAEELGRERLESFEALVPALEIPVQLDQRLALKALTDGPVTMPAGELPLHVVVSRVVPLAGRLWVLLDLTAGPWTPLGPAEAPPPRGPR